MLLSCNTSHANVLRAGTSRAPPVNSWFVLRSGACAAAFNMALDEALLVSMPRLSKPVLRFYGWTEPAASFGYFQKFREIERVTLLRPLVRRPTAGGLVPHDADWTYSVAFPVSAPWYEFTALQSYLAIHQWIQRAFERLDIRTELAEVARVAAPGQCFAGYEKFDLLWQGKKIAGAAQRRTRDGLLIQGSVQPPPLSLNRSDWEKAMIESATFDPKPDWTELSPDAELTSKVATLEQQKYSQRSYNEKR